MSVGRTCRHVSVLASSICRSKDCGSVSGSGSRPVSLLPKPRMLSITPIFSEFAKAKVAAKIGWLTASSLLLRPASAIKAWLSHLC